MSQYICTPPYVLTPPCMFGCCLHVWTPPYVWTPSCMFGHPLYVWTPPVCLDTPVCLDDVWIPPVHTQHKESILCHTKGCPYTPYNWMPNMCGWPPVCLDAPICWMPPYVWTPLYVWMPLCLDATCLFGHPLYVWMPPYVWTPPVCLDNVQMPPIYTKYKESMLCHTKGVSICPHTFGCPLNAPICVDTPCMFGCLLCFDTTCMFGCSHMFGYPLYVWMPLLHTQCKESKLCHTKGVSICPYTFGCPHMFGWPTVCLNAPHMFGHLL